MCKKAKNGCDINTKVIGVMPARINLVDGIIHPVNIFVQTQRVFLIAFAGIHGDTGDGYDFFRRRPHIVRDRPRVREGVGGCEPAQNNS